MNLDECGLFHSSFICDIPKCECNPIIAQYAYLINQLM